MQVRASWFTLQESIEASNPSSRLSTVMVQNVPSYNCRNVLPKLTLPRFCLSSNFHTWRTFYDLFSSIVINNNELTDAERMQYLKTSLSGEAERMISSLPVTDANFSIVWNWLISRYENKRFLLSAQLDKLFNIKPIKTNSSHNLSALKTTVTEFLSALRALGCPIELGFFFSTSSCSLIRQWYPRSMGTKIWFLNRISNVCSLKNFYLVVC